MTSEPSLSLCMILRDETANLRHSLGPVHRLFDEVVVIDTGSKDGTQDLARSYGAKVIEIPWSDDFATARNASIAAASKDWLFWLDGDNRIMPEDVETIRGHIDARRESILWCIEVVVPSGEQLIQKRVFPNRPEVYFEGRVHEQLVHPAHYRLVMTPVKIIHWGYADKVKAKQKGERNLRLLKDMVKRQAPDLYLCYQTGKTLFNLRRFDEALPWLRRAAAARNQADQNQGLYFHAHILQAQTLERLGRIQEAEDCLKKLIKTNPEYGPSHFYLGRHLYARSDYKEAAKRLQAFLRQGANDPVSGLNSSHLTFMAALLLGRCHEKMKNPESAMAAYRMAAKVDPANPEPSLALARISLARNRPDQALRHVRRCLELSPGNRRGTELLEDIAGHGQA
ncbi:MAG: tetratricopeptide repeat protein [Deltaproteobacteria bacterium]|nr:tetratricopeptide repeat protein [Deltaproteobacteria bacterium]